MRRRGPQIDVIEPADHSWQLDAACIGMSSSIFFPTQGDARWRQAKAVCRGCVVREECGEYALVNNIKHGIYGGMSERERRRIRRERRSARGTA